MDHGLVRLRGLDGLSLLSQREFCPLPVFPGWQLAKDEVTKATFPVLEIVETFDAGSLFGKKRMFARSTCNIDIIASIARLHDVGKVSLFVASDVKGLFWGGNNFSFFSSDFLHDVSFS